MNKPLFIELTYRNHNPARNPGKQLVRVSDIKAVKTGWEDQGCKVIFQDGSHMNAADSYADVSLAVLEASQVDCEIPYHPKSED